jgi:hypothetical protein
MAKMYPNETDIFDKQGRFVRRRTASSKTKPFSTIFRKLQAFNGSILLAPLKQENLRSV